MKIISIGFIYKPNNPYLSGLRPNNNFEKFYLRALKRNPDIEVTYYGSDTELDCRKVGKHDVYLFFDTIDWGIPYLYNVDSLKGLKVASINDAHSCDTVSKKYNRTRKQMLHDLGIDYCYYQHSPDYFHKFYPDWDKDKYWWIPIGFDEELYKDVKPWKDRRGDKILLTGVLGDEYYSFREKCNQHPLVEYVKPGNYEKQRYKKGKHDGNNYKNLLEQYKFAIASSYDVANKYFEICAAGCSCIAHIEENHDIMKFSQYFNVNLVWESSYDVLNDLINEMINCPDKSIWEERAKAGREFVFENYTHDCCAQRLVNHLKEVL